MAEFHRGSAVGLNDRVDGDTHECRAEIAQSFHDPEELCLIADVCRKVRFTRDNRNLALRKRRRQQRPELAPHHNPPDPSRKRSIIPRSIGIHAAFVALIGVRPSCSQEIHPGEMARIRRLPYGAADRE
jgi:hypothetical protein